MRLFDADGRLLKRPALPLSTLSIDISEIHWGDAFRFWSRIVDQHGRPMVGTTKIGEAIQVKRPARYAG